MANRHARVPAIGPRDAKIALIGESPGKDEIREGEPFVGRAGTQLDRMLAAAGILRRDCFITNSVKVMPWGKKEDFFFSKNSPTDEFFRGILELKSEMEEVRPNVAVPLGNYALWALTGLQDILKRRGSILESTLVPSLKVIPTIHPAFYLHGGASMSFKEPLGIWDFLRVKEESESPSIDLPSADFLIRPTDTQIRESVVRLLAGDHITADSEWYSPNDLAYIAFTNSPEWAICLAPESGLALWAMRGLLSSEVPKVWQNAAFDAVALDRIGLSVRAVRDDLMIAWNSAWADLREKRLSTISSVLTRWPFYKDDLEYVRQRDDRGRIYCCMDAVCTDEGMQKMEVQEFPYTKSRRGYEITMGAFDIFLDASRRGIRADRAAIIRLRNAYQKNADELQQTLSTVIGRDINARSSQQVIHLVYNELGVKREKQTSEKNVLLDIASTTKEEDVRIVITAIVRIRESLKMVSSYLQDDIVDRDGRIRTNWNLAGTRSGRYSTTVPWWGGVAMQTLPTEMPNAPGLGPRQVLIADPGTIFLGWDLAQAEARVVAALSNDIDLLADMARGIDIHNKLASMLPFGLSLGELEELCRTQGKDKVPQRYISKKTRHAANYVMGSTTLRLTINSEFLDTGVGIREGEARQLLKAYRDLHPGLEHWWLQVKTTLRRERRLRNYWGRSRQFTGNLDQAYTEAVSFEPQSTVADLTTLSIIEANARIKALDPNSQCFAHMHDGGLWQVKESAVDTAIAVIREVMSKEMHINSIDLRIPVDVKKGYNFENLEAVA